YKNFNSSLCKKTSVESYVKFMEVNLSIYNDYVIMMT
ncbi:hypothetical protein, partial [Escherichia coli]